MTVFDRTWDSAYEGLPPDTEQRSNGATRIRNLKVDIRQRLAVDHSTLGDANDGVHLQVSMHWQAATPPLPTAGGILYSKLVNGINELFWMNVFLQETQITTGGVVNINNLEIVFKSGPTSARPFGAQTGWTFFDTTINRPIWWTGAAWVDGAGNVV
jgi:hypothetical protein